MSQADFRSRVLSSRTWARHANPWSVYTRIPLTAIFAAIIYCRDMLGWWTLALLAAAVAWTIVNPGLFAAPATTDRWASRAVLGERVWLNRTSVPIPRHHARWALGLSIAAGLCVLPLAYGLWVLDPWASAFGAFGVSIFKLWFVDRMVWLYQDMKDADPAYSRWLY